MANDPFSFSRKVNAPTIPVHAFASGRCDCGNPLCAENSQGKHPRIKEWTKTASSDDQQLKTWARMWPQTNAAILLGTPSGLCCVDIDPRHGGSKSLEKLFPAGLPETLTVKSGGDGVHIYFKLDPLYDTSYRGNNPLLPGLEFMANGSYVICPDSTHKSGNKYSVLTDLPIADLPEALKAAIRGKRGDMATSSAAVVMEGPVFEGGRNSTIASLVGTLIRQKRKMDYVFQSAMAENEARCVPVLSEDEVRTIVKSVSKTAERREREKGGKAASHRDKEFGASSFRQFMSKHSHLSNNWLIKDWFPDLTTGLMGALPECFKTWLLCSLGYSVASGRPFLNEYPVLRNGPVLFLPQEDAHHITAQKLNIINGTQRLFTGQDEDDFEFPVMRDIPLFIHEERVFRFDDPWAMEGLYKLIEREGIILCIGDPLYSTLPNDNALEKAAELMMPLKTYRDELHCSFFFAHHFAKSATNGQFKRMRDQFFGSTLLQAWLEWSILIQRPSSKSPIIEIERTSKQSAIGVNKNVCFDISDEGFHCTITDAAPRDEEEEIKPTKKTQNAMLGEH